MATTTTPKFRTSIGVLSLAFESTSSLVANIHTYRELHTQASSTRDSAQRVKFFFFGVKKNVILWRKARKLFVGLWVLPYICIISHYLLRWGRKIYPTTYASDFLFPIFVARA